MGIRNTNDKLINKSNHTMECVDYDTAIALTGYGKFHYEIVCLCALCLLSNGFQNGLAAYIFPVAQKELDLTPAQIGFLNTFFLIGLTCSAFVWGLAADLSGRKRVLVCSLFFDGCATIAFAFMNSFAGMAMCRLLSGFLTGAPGSVTFTYLAEFHEPKLRMKMICYSGMFFTMAWLILPALAHFILPLKINLFIMLKFNFTSWRLMVALLSIPNVIACIWFLRLPETPKFLQCKGHVHQALRVLKWIHRVNNGGKSRDFPVRSLRKGVTFDLKTCENLKVRSKLLRVVQNASEQICGLFKTPFLKLTALTGTIFCCNTFGYLGLTMWIPEILIKYQEHSMYSNLSLSLKDLDFSNNNEIANISADNFNVSATKQTLILGVCSIFGSIVSGFMAGKIPMKIVPLITMLLGGISSVCINYAKGENSFFMFACIFQTAMITANLVLSSIVIELYPTKSSAIALCTSLCFGRIGGICSSMLFGIYMDQHCEVPILLVGVVSIIGACLCLFIPNNLDQKRELVQEQDDSPSIPNEIQYI